MHDTYFYTGYVSWAHSRYCLQNNTLFSRPIRSRIDSCIQPLTVSKQSDKNMTYYEWRTIFKVSFPPSCGLFTWIWTAYLILWNWVILLLPGWFQSPLAPFISIFVQYSNHVRRSITTVLEADVLAVSIPNEVGRAKGGRRFVCSLFQWRVGSIPVFSRKWNLLFPPFLQPPGREGTRIHLKPVYWSMVSQVRSRRHNDEPHKEDNTTPHVKYDKNTSCQD